MIKNKNYSYNAISVYNEFFDLHHFSLFVSIKTPLVTYIGGIPVY